jgi:hypothetical protein
MKKAILAILIALIILVAVYLIFKKKIDKMVSDFKTKVPASFADKYETNVSSASNDSDVVISSSDSSQYSQSGVGSGATTTSVYYPSVGSNDIPSYPSIDWDPSHWNKTKVLKRGVKGNEVAVLQVNLNEFVGRKSTFTVPLVPDGIFGQKTENALKALTGRTSITLTAALDLVKKFK